jgi:hypothetical protein
MMRPGPYGGLPSYGKERSSSGNKNGKKWQKRAGFLPPELETKCIIKMATKFLEKYANCEYLERH